MRRVVIVGAGVSGLSCAQALKAAGCEVLVLDRARGVGGRCATRQVGEVAIDFGPVFLHGRDAGFLAALEAVPAARVPDWPTLLEGSGQPCQPDAFTVGERRFAFERGLNAFPVSLAAGLDVRLEQTVARVVPAGEAVLLETTSGEEHQAPVVVLALASEQSRALLQNMPSPPPSVRGAAALLGLSRSQACLSLSLVYPEEAPRPAWQVCYPHQSTVLQLMSHESSKRSTGGPLALVLQARPAWSRAHLDVPSWPETLLAEAARLLGPWAAKPRAQHAHRWTWARNDRSAELAGPMLLSLPGGGHLGLCGDRFAPGGGVEAAWCSGRALAERLLPLFKEQS